MQKNKWHLDSKIEKIYKNNMEPQIDKVFKHCRQGSYKTRDRYSDGVKHFAKFTAEAFRKQNINNIQPKHLEAYIEQMKEAEYTNSYITTNLSALRYFIDQLPNGDSSRLPDNQALGVEGRSQEERIGKDRSWTTTEFNIVRQIALDKENQRVADMMQIAKEHGLRLHEVTKLDKSQVNRALKTGELRVKGKGGLIRQVPVQNREHLEKLYKQTAPGQKVFVQPNEKTHLVIQNTKNFITRHRPETIDENRANITFHGLRHTYAQNRYSELINKGMSAESSRLQVSHELGHFRPEITDVYLGGIK